MILVLYLGLALGNALLTPPYQSQDEVNHFFAIKYVADHARLPDPNQDVAMQQAYAQQGTQPPLYYVVSGLLLHLSGIETDDAWQYNRVNPHSTCGTGEPGANATYYVHDRSLPWRGTVSAIYLLRFLSILLGAVAVIGVYRTALLLFPQALPLCWLATAFTAFNPEFLSVISGVTNDALVLPLCTWAIYVTIRLDRMPDRPRLFIFAGVLLGAAAVTKLTGLPLAACTFAVILWMGWRRRAEDAPIEILGWTVRRLALVAIPFLLLAGWWYVRNAVLHGDPMLVGHHLDIVPDRHSRSPDVLLAALPAALLTYWGLFTCFLTPPPWLYAIWTVMTLGGLVSLLIRHRRLDLRQRRSLAILSLWLLFAVAAWLRWMWAASGVRGRLLLPANISISILSAAGLCPWSTTPADDRDGLGKRKILRVLRRGSPFLATLIALGSALWVLLGILWPSFRLPPRYEGANIPPIPNRMDGIFGQQIELLGYSIEPRSLEPGQTLEVTLYLSASRPMTQAYSLGIWLLSPIPGADARLTGLDTWPGRGTYPTFFWAPNEVIVDRYRLTIPDDVPRTQAWMLQINAFSRHGDWLPFAIDGETIGGRALLGWVRVGATAPPDVPPTARRSPPAAFGGQIALAGARATPTSADRVQVDLWWRALAAPTKSYVTFVHLLTADGELVASGDGPPLSGGYPTAMWEAGDMVHDQVALPLEPGIPTGEYTVRVGWYDPDTGQRLATQAGTSATVGTLYLP